MAIIFMDGFDHIQQSGSATDILDKWQGPTSYNASQIVAVAGRASGVALQLAHASYWVSAAIPSLPSTVIINFSYNPLTLPTAASPVITIYDSGFTTHAVVYLQPTGYLSGYRNTTLLGTSSAPLSANQWTHLEIKITIHDSAGVIEIRKDGVVILNLTSVDTKNAGNAEVAAVRISGFTGGALFDNFVVMDTTGASMNDFVGDCLITTYAADADGTYTEMACSAGSDHYALVDEMPPSETDYNYSNTLNHRETYSHATTAAIATTIHAVQANAHVSNPDGGTVKITGLCRSGTSPGDNLAASEVTVSATGAYAMSIWEQDPEDAVAWTPAKIDAAEFGVKITTA